MKRLLMAVALSTFCLAASGCKPQIERVVTSLPTPPERLVCEAKPQARPTVPAEYVIDWSKVTTVAQARVEHDKYVATVRTREGVVAGYILNIEGRLFTCWNNMEWRRQFEATLPKSEVGSNP